jgi:hypothetical protein
VFFCSKTPFQFYTVLLLLSLLADKNIESPTIEKNVVGHSSHQHLSPRGLTVILTMAIEDNLKSEWVGKD